MWGLATMWGGGGLCPQSQRGTATGLNASELPNEWTELMAFN